MTFPWLVQVRKTIRRWVTVDGGKTRAEARAKADAITGWNFVRVRPR